MNKFLKMLAISYLGISSSMQIIANHGKCIFYQDGRNVVLTYRANTKAHPVYGAYYHNCHCRSTKNHYNLDQYKQPDANKSSRAIVTGSNLINAIQACNGNFKNITVNSDKGTIYIDMEAAQAIYNDIGNFARVILA